MILRNVHSTYLQIEEIVSLGHVVKKAKDKEKERIQVQEVEENSEKNSSRLIRDKDKGIA